MLGTCNLIYYYNRYFGLLCTEFYSCPVLSIEWFFELRFFLFCIFQYISFLQLCNCSFFFSYLERGTSNCPTDKSSFNLATVVAETLGFSVQEESVSNCLVW